jgi:hypothetical protein
MEDNEPHNTSLHINIQENIGMPDPKIQQKLLNNLTSLQGNNEEGKRPRLRTLAPKPPPAEARSRSDSDSSVHSEEPFPDFDPNFPSIEDGTGQNWEIMSNNNNVSHNEVNYQYLNNFQAPSMGQQPQLQHPGNFNSMNNNLHPNMAQPANPFTQNQAQGIYNSMQNVNMGQPQNQFYTQDQRDHQQMMHTINQGYITQQQQQEAYRNHPQHQRVHGQHPQFHMGPPSSPFTNVQITQGPPVSTQNLAYVNPVDTSPPRFHQTPSNIDHETPAANWDAYIDAEEQAKSNMLRKRSLTSAHPEMGPNSYRNAAMNMGVNHHYLVGEYISNEEAWSGAPRGAIKRTFANPAPQFTQQQIYSQQMNNYQMNAQQMNSQQVNLQQPYPQQVATPQMTPQPIQYGTSPGQMGPPGFTQIPGRNRSMSRTSLVTSPNLLGRKNSTSSSSRGSKASPAHSRSTSTGVSKRTSENGSTKRSSFSKPGLGPKISVPGWASGGPNTRRPSVNGGTKANPIRVSTSPVGLLPNGGNKQMMSPALTLTSPEATSTSQQDMMLPSPEMVTSDQSMAFLKDALQKDPNFTISDVDIPPTQESQLSSLLQAQIHLSQLVTPPVPPPSLDSPLEAAVEIQEEGEVKELMNKLIRALQTGVDGLVKVAKIEDKAGVDVPVARGRMKQALGDLVGEMGKVLGFGNQEPWDPDMSDMNAILEGWAPEGGNMDDLFGDGLANENGITTGIDSGSMNLE